MKNNRVQYLINLGVTNQKIDKLERITITGRVGLNIISHDTKVMQLNKQTLKTIGDLLMLIIDHGIPTTEYTQSFSTSDKYELEYIRKFGQQLCIQEDEGLERFCIPAISILVNNDLRPHCDSLNPTQKKLDYTLSISVQVPLDILPVYLQNIFKDQYNKTIPFCIVAYRRNCVVHYSKRMHAIDKYINGNMLLNCQRYMIVKVIRDVRLHKDYIGYFFDTKKRKNMISKFNYDPCSIFRSKLAIIKQSVDYMVNIHLYLFIHFNWYYISLTITILFIDKIGILVFHFTHVLSL